MTTPPVELRLYCHGLGDCNLVGLPKRDGGIYWMLFDCGIHSAAAGGGEIMRKVVADIAIEIEKRTSGPAPKPLPHIDVIVGTHEHWDHLSGFMQAAEQFKGLTVGEVWFSWAEDPSDEDARKFDKYKVDTANALAAAAVRMRATPGFGATADGMDSLLGFVFGAKGEKVRDARERLRAMGTVRHLVPGSLAPLPAEVAGIRAYVLGPPRDLKMLGIEDIPTETYGFDGASLGVLPLANALGVNDGTVRIMDDPAAPFEEDAGHRLSMAPAGSGDPYARAPDAADTWFLWKHYLGPDDCDQGQAWRRIDGDWLASAPELAIQLDSRTNNSSLVVAFEIIETGHVLLFAADAQVGNWLTWSDITFPVKRDGAQVTGADLIERTVFYKVGHHGSRNATLGPKGLERMDGSMLVAFNPTDESLAGRVGWKDFPAPKLTTRLRERTSGRYIQSDEAWLKSATGPAPIKKGGALVDFEVLPNSKCIRLIIA
jgi:glyoxylase-like metal-dependent hydrolase (beta-lactamase superfamily II)